MPEPRRHHTDSKTIMVNSGATTYGSGVTNFDSEAMTDVVPATESHGQ